MCVLDVQALRLLHSEVPPQFLEGFELLKAGLIAENICHVLLDLFNYLLNLFLAPIISK